MQRAVLRRGDMHERLVLQQLVLVQLRKQCAGPQANAARPGNGLGGQGRIEHHCDPARAEETVQFRLHPGGEGLGRDLSGARRNPRSAQKGVGGLEEEVGRVQHAQVQARIVEVRTPIQG
ncbi:hypothetical protein D3C76_1263060 [compost metagenome]